ncbi:MAG: M20/M25/M40 family metallo-hydrolase [Bacteroidales bacterium]|nr:M20/M25/M40 family metallo-hydrolase [Bacteroidales bacterium]MDT8374761.1 M20/M25/M40 family metallo-hydrolase [Bacteroidales bacterium]
MKTALITARRAIITILLLAMFMPLSSQEVAVDLEMVYKIRQEGQRNSEIETLSYIMTDLAGPRLTGSQGLDRANEIARAKLAEYGLSNVRIEKVSDFSRGGWDYSKAYAAMTAPYYNNFSVTPVAWTSGTNGPVRGEVVLVDIRTVEDMEKYRGKLKGKIIIAPSNRPYEASFEPLAKRLTDDDLERISMVDAGGRPSRRNMGDYMAMRELRNKINEFLLSEEILMIINQGNAFNIPRSTGAQYDGKGQPPVTEINIPQEPHFRMERLLKKGEKVEVEAEINTEFTPDRSVYNVIAEIPGTDPKLKDQVVLLGGHIDSWHGGTGAADNASGCIVMMEAMRILKSLDARPRRTIRIALWGGEEQGLYGSRGYASKYLFDKEKKEKKPGYDKFSVYFNMDNGTGRYRGIYLQENNLVRPLFEEWMGPMEDMGFNTIAIRNTGGTDHQSFDGVGLPGFQFIQDEIEYGRGYHTLADTYERLLLPDLRHNAIITAWLAWNAAMEDDLMPRKPEMKSTERRSPYGF